jgi:class 3 adenylate cyclase
MKNNLLVKEESPEQVRLYKKQLNDLQALQLRDTQTILQLRNELSQKKQAFSVLAELQSQCTVETPLDDIYSQVVHTLLREFVMDKVLLLTPGTLPGSFKPRTWSGFSPEETPILEMREIDFTLSMFGDPNYLLHNSGSGFTTESDLISWSFNLPYFIAVPVIIDKSLVSILMAGRVNEAGLSHPSLNDHDVETLLAISAMISTFLQNKRVAELKLRIEQQLRDKNEMMNKFSQQVSKNVAVELVRNNIVFKSEKREVCILFLDIRNFTPYAENKEPEEVVQYLNKLFDFMIGIVDRNNGIVNQFLGDGFMATFGAPITIGNSSQNAVNAACEIIETLKEKNQSGAIWETTIGIGIHKGEAVTGNIGSSIRSQYSVTGNVVILASRIEQLTKEQEASILISAEVYDSITLENIPSKSIGLMAVKGRSEPIELYKITP